MSTKLKHVMPPLWNDDYKTILMEYVNMIVTKNTYEEVIESLNKNYLHIIEPLNNIRDEKTGDISESSNQQLISLVKKDYDAFENIKNRDFIKKSHSSIKEKFDEFIDNLFDYENVMTGVYLQKTKKFEEKIDKIDLIDLQKNFISCILLMFSIISLIGKYEDKNKIILFLDIALKYSEIIQSYADTVDILTNE